MSHGESERLLHALSTIEILSDEALLRHEVQLSKLVRRWNKCRRGARSTPKAVTRLEQLELCLNKSRDDKLEPFLRRSSGDAVGQQVNLQQDTRVNDILLATQPPPGQQELYKFRTGLAKRSLAAQYDQWQKGQLNARSRVHDLAEDCSRAQERDSGRISEFLAACGLPHETRVVDAVKQGRQLLVFERKTATTGSSALLFFCMGYFSKIKYSEFDSLLGVFERNAWMIITANKSSAWFNECVAIYEGLLPSPHCKIRLTWRSPTQEYRCEGAWMLECSSQRAMRRPPTAMACANFDNGCYASLSYQRERYISQRCSRQHTFAKLTNHCYY